MSGASEDKGKQIEREVQKIERAVREIERIATPEPTTKEVSRPPGKPTTDPPAVRPKKN